MANIAVNHVQQSFSYWCWAACSEMFVARYGNTTLTQAAFATEHNKKFQRGMNVMADYTEVAWLLKNIAGHSVERRIGLEAQLDWDPLNAILDKCRLVMACAANHAWLIVGTEMHPTHGQVLWVHDPDNSAGPSRARYGAFKNLWKTTVMLSQNDAGALD